MRWLWWTLNLLGFTLAVVPTALVVANGLERNATWGYTAAEWLINNEGGFTRRGLSGDILLGTPWISDRTALILLVVTLLIVVAAGFARLVWLAVRRTHAGWPLLLWLLPGGLALSTVQNTLHGSDLAGTTAALRKEYLFLALLIGVILVGVRWPGRRAWVIVALASSVACGLGVLVHEGLAIVTCAAIVYLMFWVHPDPPASTTLLGFGRPRSPSRWQLPVPNFLALAAPSLIALGTVSAVTLNSTAQYRLTWSAVDATTKEWLSLPTVQVWGADAGFPAALWWLTTSPQDGINWLVRDYLETGLWVAWAAAAAFVVVWVVAAGWLLNSRRSARTADLISLALVTAAILPMFVLALDWGRWIALIGVITGVLILGRVVLGRPQPVARRLSLGTALVALLLVSSGVGTHIPVAGGDFWLARWLG